VTETLDTFEIAPMNVAPGVMGHGIDEHSLDVPSRDGRGSDGRSFDGPRPVDALRLAVDGLAGSDWSRLAGPELLDVVREVEVQKRRLAAVDQALLAQLNLRHVAGEMGCRDTATLLVDQLRVNPVEARARVGDAEDFGPSATLGGQPLPPQFPDLAEAIAAGEISVGHARAVTKFTGAIPHGLPEGVVETAQAHLLKAAAETYPAQVAKLATALLARLDQDGPEPHEETEQRRRGLTLATGSDGWSKSEGYLSPLLTASLNALFDSLGGPKPAEDGTPDDRSPSARRHDALLDACERLLRSDTLPDTGGAPVTILVTIDETDLRERVADATGASRTDARDAATTPGTTNPDTAASGAAASGTTTSGTAASGATAPSGADRAKGHVPSDNSPGGDTATQCFAAGLATTAFDATPRRATALYANRFGATGHGPGGDRGYAVTSHGHLLPIADVLRLAAEANIIPVVLNDAGGIVSYGRAQRLATAAMRRALAARDGGCSFPGCDIPPEWCQIHHTTAWEQGGHTAISELTMVCGHHHRDHQRQGWQCRMINGVPWWVPPKWIDTLQRPRRNHAHTRIQPQQRDQAAPLWLAAA